MAKAEEKTYTITQSDLEKFARLHKAFCLQHTSGGRLDQVRDKDGTVDLRTIREQSGQVLAALGVSPDDQIIHS
jgi:hypothetical protein